MNTKLSYRGSKSAMVLSESGLLRSLSRRLRISWKRGLFERSCNQHCSMSWYTAEGQSIGAGRRKASLMAFITLRGKKKSFAQLKSRIIVRTLSYCSKLVIYDHVYLVVAHIPVGPFSKSHHLPHDYAKAPNITGRGELPVSNSLRSRPANGNFPSLKKKPQKRLTECFSLRNVKEIIIIKSSC